MARSPINAKVALEAEDGEVLPGKPIGGSDEPTAVDRAEAQTVFNRMRKHFAKQPKVTVRVQEDTTVQINGYGFLIKGKTRVEVPEQVAQILEESGRI